MTFDLMPLARRMIAIDSRSQRSNLELLAFLIPLCLEAGLQTSLQEEDRDGVKQFNLIASRGPLDGETLLLATHSDTVPPGDASLWTATGGDPFALTEKDGALYGLGVADVKLDLLCKLLALDSLKGVPLGRNVALGCHLRRGDRPLRSQTAGERADGRRLGETAETHHRRRAHSSAAVRRP